MRKLVELKQWGGVTTDGGRVNKQPNAALTRNVMNGADGTLLTARGGCSQTGLPTFSLDRSFDTLWAFSVAKYPGLVFVAQISATGKYSGNTWIPDITGTSRVKCLGVYKPDNVDSDQITAGSPSTELAAGGMIPSVRGT